MGSYEGLVKTQSVNFAAHAKRSVSVGESAWKRLVRIEKQGFAISLINRLRWGDGKGQK